MCDLIELTGIVVSPIFSKRWVSIEWVVGLKLLIMSSHAAIISRFLCFFVIITH